MGMLNITFTYFIRDWVKKLSFVVLNAIYCIIIYEFNWSHLLDAKGLILFAFFLGTFYYFEERSSLLLFLNFYQTSQDLN